MVCPATSELSPIVGNICSLAIPLSLIPSPRWLLQTLPDRLAPTRSLTRASFAPYSGATADLVLSSASHEGGETAQRGEGMQVAHRE